MVPLVSIRCISSKQFFSDPEVSLILKSSVVTTATFLPELTSCLWYNVLDVMVPVYYMQWRCFYTSELPACVRAPGMRPRFPRFREADCEWTAWTPFPTSVCGSMNNPKVGLIIDMIRSTSYTWRSCLISLVPPRWLARTGFRELLVRVEALVVLLLTAY